MIDKTTGKIITDEGYCLGPETTLKEFEASSIGKMSIILVSNEPWCSFQLPFLKINGNQFGCIVCFYYGKIDSISLCLYNKTLETSSDCWSKQKKIKQHKDHTNLILEAVGPKNQFCWGSISAEIDVKSKLSTIEIRYKQ